MLRQSMWDVPVHHNDESEGPWSLGSIAEGNALLSPVSRGWRCKLREF